MKGIEGRGRQGGAGTVPHQRKSGKRPTTATPDYQNMRADGPTLYQDEVLQLLADTGRLAVYAPHGAGKTAVLSWLIHWFALTRDGEDWKVVTTASAWRQLIKFLWPEVRKWGRRIRWERVGRKPYMARTELMDLSLKLLTGEAFAVASDQPDLIEGAHADSLLYIFDESKTIPGKTFDAAEGAFSGAGKDTSVEAYAVTFSTPGEPAGRFYDICSRKPGYEDWTVRHITLEECVVAGRMSREWVEHRKAQWGEESAVYQNRVEGVFATGDENGLVPLRWIEEANERWLAWVEAGKPGVLDAIGVDPAYTGEDKTCIAERYGHAIDTLRYHTKEGPTDIAYRVKGILDKAKSGTPIVDAIGMGGGVYNTLVNERKDPVAFVGSEHSDNMDATGELGFRNRRSEAAWRLREALDRRSPADQPSQATLALPPDDLLTGDLTALHWSVANGKYVIEPKPEFRKRVGRSTNAGDAVMMACWEDTAPYYQPVAFVDEGVPQGGTPAVPEYAGPQADYGYRFGLGIG